MNGRPLDGITVLSVEQAVAAPFATRQLADLGARVIKIERADGDFARRYDSTVHGTSSFFAWLNRGKESVVLDLKTDADAELFRSIAATADIVVQNLAPGALDRLGLGYGALSAGNPRLIYAEISGYGTGGSYTRKKAYDLLVQCEVGLLSVTGTPEQPSKVGASVADIAAGMYVYSGVLAALIQRGRTGVGDRIEVSMLEALGEWMQQPYLFAEYGGTPPQRHGASHATIAPYGPFEACDGTVFIGIQNETEFAGFCRDVLGDAGLADDSRFSLNEHRVANRDALNGLIGAALADTPSEEVIRRLDSLAIANARMRTMSEFSAHPQLAERSRWVDVETPGGPARSLLPPVTADSYRPAMKPVPDTGEHTDRVRREFTAPDERN
ncbi:MULTISPECIES: CaiB/BaiF CoA transferase family protein [unclassified Pseudoclavibacter]|uniref:CaiB/BaiF CoA transferase family protein n=1 Tax=unclassified Pseudoclavibacter TaxID=2615177 RepID=UPI001BA4D92F|nr:CaiB/BaiF CoA-transferase family protein [Pseudoclavibacter sp. Marseille-Q4354]MBS3179428.1 CoA transferase [Pseudoclavibacter sp. Marseille-Q4354]